MKLHVHVGLFELLFLSFVLFIVGFLLVAWVVSKFERK